MWMSTARVRPPRPSLEDRIQKTILLQAPRSRVWQALTNFRQFGQWFRVDLAGPFVPGQHTEGTVTYPGYEHLRFEVVTERMEPERLFSWRWEPGGDPDSDPAEAMTLVTFELEEVPEGTRLTVTESGFDQLPVAQRSKAFRENTEGWSGQLENLRQHLAAA
jgi:uncharacterized protein YndB with AHSA1/START domain